MLTQMGVLAFLREHANELKDIISSSVRDLGAVYGNVFAVTKYTKVIEAIKSMHTVSLSAIPMLKLSDPPEEDQILQDASLLTGVFSISSLLSSASMGKGRKLADTFSATDLRGRSVSQLQSLLSTNVVEFKQLISTRAIPATDPSPTPSKKLITRYHETSLREVIDKAVEAHAHRVWVVDHEGLLQGLVSLTDML